MGLYSETVDYWSAGGSILDAVDAVGFGITNPATVGDAIAVGAGERVAYVKDKAEKTAELVGDFVKGSLIKTALVVGVSYLTFLFVSSYAKAKASKLAK